MSIRELQRWIAVRPLTLLCATAPAACLAFATPAWGADTTETWAPGAADVDFYLGTDGLGGDASSQTLYGDLMVGYGAADRLSVFLGTRLEANGSLGDASPGLRMGVFGTVVETGVFDLDLALEVGAGGRGLSEIHVAPGLELNLDLRSPLGPVGLYLRAQVPVQGTDGAPEFQLDLTPGLYWTVRDGHQLLLEYRGALVPARGEDPWSWESGAAALGYNVSLSGSLELITEVSAGPRAGGGVGVGAMLGFIATIPGAGG